MKILVLITALLTCGGCVESTFGLSRGSALPLGLRSDEEVQRVATTASRIELWLYSGDPPTLKFFYGHVLVLSRQGRYTRSDDEGVFGMFVSFNGVESKFRRVAFPNVVAVEEGWEGGTPAPQPAARPGGAGG
jgi:hypothetical protein